MSDVQSRLEHPANLCNKLVEFRPLHPGGKNVGDVDLPPALRTLVAAAAEQDTHRSVAKTFDLSPAGVSAIKKREEDAGRVVPKADQVREKALDALVGLFDQAITEDKLKGMKPREAVSAAKDLASVVERVSPRTSGGPNVQFVVFQPTIRSEDEFPVKDITPTSPPSGHTFRKPRT